MSDFFLRRNKQSSEKLHQLLKELPYFCTEYFIGIESTSSLLTRLNYAYDLRVFFDFLVRETEEFHAFSSPAQLKIDDLERLSPSHLEYFMSYLNFYTFHGRECSNHEKAKARKMSSVRSMLRYFYRKELLSQNISEKVRMPKLHDREIIRLEQDEVSKILNAAENGDELSGRQKSFNRRTYVRDSAILTLFLGTGIRISELVGLNNEDIDFDNFSFVVTRKGGNKTILYFSEEVADALRQYVDEKRADPTIAPKENALFLSLRRTRISVRAVEILVKKYAKIAAPLKKITPHKLRSTYGTNLYRETHDIYIVADVLGHRDVNTTKKHYAAISDDIRREAAEKVILREKKR